MSENEQINLYNKIDNMALELKSGKLEVFPDISEHYNPIIKKIVFSITHCHNDTEDVAQETLLTVLEKIDQWQGKNFHGWILRIAKNYAINCLRKRKRKRKNKDSTFILESYEEVNTVVKNEEIAKLHLLLASLPEQQKEILYLKHFKQLSIKEIAENRGCAEGTVKSTLHQTIQKLKEQFKKSGLLD